ncbi:MAG: helix-turn-helix domain-containing protein [Treponema sp.]|jgi:DNA-binding LacI/PurR family transcriptional regulator/AraC-like DNA-binding protein/signal transduction histidine kinase|nr:helix-turn-helix domain-containing protein [Treponema sp.]
MASAKKRIGLVLASIHTGASLNVWPCFVRTAHIENASLFIFPGGRLNARQDSENLRNPVYSLVNTENLDGLISWSSAVRYTETREEFEAFHAGFDPLPYVTLAYKIPGHPCVDFDAYNGMRALVSHCVRAHGARSIAFLRGPDFHQSAVARLQGYRDALREAGLPVLRQSPLVTDPFNWNSGEAAAAQLFKDRSLVPGRDFDTLIGSSDLMALGALNYFLEAGYHVPRDYRAGGFNNSIESRITESPLTTVHIPYTELSAESFGIVLKLLGKRSRNIADLRLASKLVIRESCGCEYYHAGETGGASEYAFENGGQDAGSRGTASGDIIGMAAAYLNLESGYVEDMVFPLTDALFRGRDDVFFHLFEKALIRFFNSGRDVERLLKLLGDISLSGLLPPDRISRIEPVLYRTVFHIRERLTTRGQYEKEQWNTALNSLKCELLGTRDRRSLVQSLARHLPKIGIATAVIVLFEDEKISRCVGGFSPQGISPQREQPFPATLLVPAALKGHYADGIFMVQPLFIENQSLGYFVHNVPFYDGVIFEELRSAVSYALKGISLLEEVVRTKRIAEQEERAKSELLRALEHELYDPLSEVMDQVEELEKKISPGKETGDAIIRLKSLISSREAEAGSLIDLTLSRIDESVPRKTLFDPDELLPGIGAFPLLCGDTARLSQCFSLIREEYGDTVSAALTYGGLALTFRRPGKTGTAPEVRRKHGLLLAEQIILTHGGEFSRDEARCALTLPWTTLTGQDAPVQAVGRQDHVLALSDSTLLPANFFDLPLVRDIRKSAELPGRTAFIVWNAAASTKEEYLQVLRLRRRPEFAEIPFLCYGKRSSAGETYGFTGTHGSEKSIAEAVENALRSPERGIVLTIGAPEPGEYPRFGMGGDIPAEIITIDSMALFNETVADVCPTLILVNGVNTETAAAIRRHPLTVTAPVVMIGGLIDSAAEVMTLSGYSRLIICNTAAASSQEFRRRIKALIAGDEILPPHTGALVKKTILYFNKYAGSPISRWKLAEAVNVSEDYLTRIFHREMGLSLWDYLNRYRVFLAANLLRRTDETIQEIAARCGFQDQAYFCRVFKKIYGSPPGQLRKRSE